MREQRIFGINCISTYFLIYKKRMKAKVQYNDYQGTAAADIADEFVNSMDEYLSLKSKRFNKDDYHCVGCELRPFGTNKLDIEFYCRDLSTGRIVSMRFNQQFDLTELLVIFKRITIVIGEQIEDIETPQTETIYLD